MSVKKMGSKLAQGVRQVKAQQVNASVKAEGNQVSLTATHAPVAASGGIPAAPVPAKAAASVGKPAVSAQSKVSVAKTTATKSVLKAAASKPKLSGMQHPTRVWPD